MRGLKPSFLKDLKDKTGLLYSIAEQIRRDQTLDLQIRKNYVNVYYRGGNLMRISHRRGDYVAEFDKKYAKNLNQPLPHLPSTLRFSNDVASWLKAFPIHKEAMDEYFSSGRGEEREFQQLVVRDNNLGKMGRATDLFICDIEYADKGCRFDMVGVQWPSTGTARKQQYNHQLVMIEIKYGDHALRGGASLSKHIKDIDRFLSTAINIKRIKEEMRTVFNQKRDMKLINCPKSLESFGDIPPLMLIILANHDPDSDILRKELSSRLPKPRRAELRFATSTFMGYGLFKPALLTLDELCTRFGACI